MFKVNYKNLAASVLAAVIAQNASAMNIKLDEEVAIKNESNRTIVKAYRDGKNCAMWYYYAGQHIVGGDFLHRTELTPINWRGKDYLALVSTMDMRSESEITQADFGRLKEIIAAKLKTDPICGSLKIEAAGVVLSPGLSRAISVQKSVANGDEPYNDIVPTYVTPPSVYTDSTNPIAITFRSDASNKNNLNDLKKMITLTKDSHRKIGELYYLLSGVTSELNARMIIKGKLSAQFDSAVQNIHCETKDKDQDLNFAGGMMGAGGGGGGFGSIGYDEKTKTCLYQLVTQFQGGEFGLTATFDFKNFNFKDKDNKPLMIASCDEKGDCNAIELESYAKHQLWTLWITANFDVAIKKLTESTYQTTLGRKGTATSNIDGVVEYGRSFYGEIAIAVPVYAKALSADSLNVDSGYPVFEACVKSSYVEQIQANPGLKGIRPLPVADKCLNAEVGKPQ